MEVEATTEVHKVTTGNPVTMEKTFMIMKTMTCGISMMKKEITM
jgi:hypothetical protein